MGKFDHIPELTGADTYLAWMTQIQLVLMNDDLWCHVNDVVDPADLLGSASYLPVAVAPAAPTADELLAMRAWLIDDSKAKTIILRRLTPGVSLLIPHTTNTTARGAWQILRDHFHRSDVSSQYVLRRQIQALRMKDSQDGSRYVGQHISYRDRLIGMGATYSNEEAVFHLLTGLPSAAVWQQFKSQLEQRMHDVFSATVVSSAVAAGAPVAATLRMDAFTFENCAARITAEAVRQLNERASVSGPGSEYANAVASAPLPSANVNPITGLRKNKNNPGGIWCLTTGCGKGDHDQAHCFAKGGGMEGQAPWQRNKQGKGTSVSPFPSTSAPAIPPPPVSAFAGSETAAAAFFGDLSCASVTELPDTVTGVLSAALSTILDSGTTTTLIQDRSYFWTYSTEDVVTVRTANHGSLPTSGRGDCVALLTLNGQKRRVRLTNCLHAPSAMMNLLSVGWMLSRGWECNFRGSPPRCDLVYRGTSLGSLAMSNNLFIIDLEFLRPPTSSSHSPSPGAEFTAFVQAPMTLDLWHARLGHIGGEAVRRLPLFATGATLTSSMPLSRCESCILGKHPRQPYPPSSSLRASHFLDLVHSDVCGPLPVLTPHGKKYFIIFLDDHTNVLDLHLLATKDQALEAWRLTRARWETRSGLRVKTFRSDNGGEFLTGTAFSAELAAAGIERQLSAPYAHQQNGKAERVIRTIEGRMYAMLDHAKLPRALWGEAALCAAYLFNRTESRALAPGVTPYEALHQVKPDLSHLRVFGARCFARIPAELQTKLGPRSREAIFLGYPPGVKAWRCRDKETGAFFNSRDVIFDESFTTCPFPDSDSEDEEGDTPLPMQAAPGAVPPPALPVTVAPQAAPPVAVAPLPPSADTAPRRSARARPITERGQLYIRKM